MNIVILAGILITVFTLIPVIGQLRTHPRGLVVLFFAEMWERFSYYGMRGILIFYLTQHFLYQDGYAQGMYGAYTSLVYLLPLIGGFVADRYLGTRKSIAFGALLLVAGHLLMAVEQQPAVQTLTYQGATYEFASEGRMERREVQLDVNGQTYDFTGATVVNAAGQEVSGIQINGLPADAPLPAFLEEGSYQLGVTGRLPMFEAIMFLALALIATGVGFLKPNISSIVGQLYPGEDPRRDSGFTLYYYGINLGAFWAGILCAWLGVQVGWWAGFGLAGIGMALGFIVFVMGKASLEGNGEPPNPQTLREPGLFGLGKENLIYLLGVLGVFAVWGLLQANAAARTALDAMIDTVKAEGGPDATLPIGLALADFFAVVGVLLLVGSIVVLGYIGRFMAAKCTKQESDRLLLALILIAASVVFWTLFEQAGSSLNQFAERATDLTIVPAAIQLGPLFVGTEAQLAAAGLAKSSVIFIDGSFAAGQAQSFNSGFILLFAPMFAALWAWLEKRKLDPNDPMKFALALLQVGAGFLVLVWGANFAGPDFRVPLVFLALAYLLHTTGELFLSPVGLSMVTKLSPAAVVSTMMAIWFLSSAWAQWIGAIVASATQADTVGGRVLNPQQALATYVDVFQSIGLFAIGVGILLAIASPFLHKLSHGSR
ncbi:MAG: peptide MFS transporter [Caulobacterales bacterium]|jgi:POT family proton-dependent oligopeptide transporter